MINTGLLSLVIPYIDDSGQTNALTEEYVMAVFVVQERETFSPWQKLPRQQIVPRGGILLASLREKITPTPNKTAKEATKSQPMDCSLETEPFSRLKVSIIGPAPHLPDTTSSPPAFLPHTAAPNYPVVHPSSPDLNTLFSDVSSIYTSPGEPFTCRTRGTFLLPRSMTGLYRDC
ncbi:hypothetical protein Bbelb_104210 [Branchiostoma belcheri]|nr:hypothetical protein Bbelb_104210 [Branchiostoma belcheri]